MSNFLPILSFLFIFIYSSNSAFKRLEHVKPPRIFGTKSSSSAGTLSKTENGAQIIGQKRKFKLQQPRTISLDSYFHPNKGAEEIADSFERHSHELMNGRPMGELNKGGKLLEHSKSFKYTKPDTFGIEGENEENGGGLGGKDWDEQWNKEGNMHDGQRMEGNAGGHRGNWEGEEVGGEEIIMKDGMENGGNGGNDGLIGGGRHLDLDEQQNGEKMLRGRDNSLEREIPAKMGEMDGENGRVEESSSKMGKTLESAKIGIDGLIEHSNPNDEFGEGREKKTAEEMGKSEMEELVKNDEMGRMGEMIPNLGEGMENNDGQIVVYSKGPKMEENEAKGIKMMENEEKLGEHLMNYQMNEEQNGVADLGNELEGIGHNNNEGRVEPNLGHFQGENDWNKQMVPFGGNGEMKGGNIGGGGNGAQMDLAIVPYGHLEGGKEMGEGNAENGEMERKGEREIQQNLLENPQIQNGHSEGKEGNNSKCHGDSKIVCNLEREQFFHFSKTQNPNEILEVAKKCSHLALSIGEFRGKNGGEGVEVKIVGNIEKARELKATGAKLLASWNFGGELNRKVLDNQVKRGGQMFGKKRAMGEDRVKLIREMMKKSDNSIFDGILLDFSEFSNFNKFYADLLRDFYLEIISKKLPAKSEEGRILAIRLENAALEKLKNSEFAKNLKYADLVITKPGLGQKDKKILNLAEWLVENMENIKNKGKLQEVNCQKIVIGMPMEGGGKCGEKLVKGNEGKGRKKKNSKRRQKRVVLEAIEEEGEKDQKLRPQPKLRLMANQRMPDVGNVFRRNKIDEKLANWAASQYGHKKKEEQPLLLEWHGGVEGHNKMVEGAQGHNKMVEGAQGHNKMVEGAQGHNKMVEGAQGHNKMVEVKKAHKNEGHGKKMEKAIRKGNKKETKRLAKGFKEQNEMMEDEDFGLKKLFGDEPYPGENTEIFSTIKGAFGGVELALITMDGKNKNGCPNAEEIELAHNLLAPKKN